MEYEKLKISYIALRGKKKKKSIDELISVCIQEEDKMNGKLK